MKISKYLNSEISHVSIIEDGCEESLYKRYVQRYTYKAHSEGDTGQRLRHPAHINTLCACFVSVYLLNKTFDMS